MPSVRAPKLARVAFAAALGLALAAAGAAAVADPPPGGYAPDPPGYSSKKQWVFEVFHSKGRTSITRARPVVLRQAASTARVMGRFAVELYVGKELLDRVRFNVPLTGDAPEKDPRRPFRRPTFDEGVTTRMRVQMADNPRATWGRLVDRMTGAEQRFWWPPDEQGRLVPTSQPPGGAPAVDAGAGDAGDAGAPADAGTGDGGVGDSGAADGGVSDGGLGDGGVSDGGAADAR